MAASLKPLLPWLPRQSLARLKVMRQAVYGVTLGSLVGLLTLMVYQCLNLYLEVPTYFSTQIVPQNQAEFPAMTVCPEPDGYKEAVLKAHGIPDLKTYHRGGSDRNMTWSSNRTDTSESELFLLSTYEPQEMFKKIYIRFFKAGTNGHSHVVPATRMKTVLGEQRHRQFGRCYTLLPEPWMKKLGIYWIRITMHIPVKIYLHQSQQFLDFSGRMGYKVFLGQQVQVQANFEDIRMISKEKQLCHSLNYDNCMYSALENHMMQGYKCVVPYIISDKPICTEQEKVNKTYWIAWNRVTNQHNDCNAPCNVLLVKVSGKNVQPFQQDLGKASFYFVPRVALNKEKYFYNAVRLVAEIGGYVALILGVSFFHMTGWATKTMDTKINVLEEKIFELKKKYQIAH